jgi:hypothetical protein
MDEDLQGHSWKQVKDHLSSGFTDWAERHGYDVRWISVAALRVA